MANIQNFPINCNCLTLFIINGKHNGSVLSKSKFHVQCSVLLRSMVNLPKKMMPKTRCSKQKCDLYLLNRSKPRL